MAKEVPSSIRDLLLVRRGLVFVHPNESEVTEPLLQAFELELARIGYAVSTRLREALGRGCIEELAELHRWVPPVLLGEAGANQKHRPLFRKFPKGIPHDTEELWWKKVLSHFLAGEGQPCLFCRQSGTTHVLNPCRHVVCDRCFDGASYSACPVCEHHVDLASPFFQLDQARGLPEEQVTFRLLDLGGSLEAEAHRLFVGLCARTSPLSPADRIALTTLVTALKESIIPHVPATIPVRENMAIVFGTLLGHCEPEAVLPQALSQLKTATDLLRVIAVMSGADASLQRQTVHRQIQVAREPSRFWGKLAKLLDAPALVPRRANVTIAIKINRFKMVRLPRRTRRSLLAILEGMDPERMLEDMLRHRSYWVWAGEFLHPHEYGRRFPHVAHAFEVLRGKAPDGKKATEFRTFYGHLERGLQSHDTEGVLALLTARPGELARRYDWLVRRSNDALARERVLSAVEERIPTFSTPVLVTLHSHLPTRGQPAKVRVFWPKGAIAKGVFAPDHRESLPPQAIEPVVNQIEAELLSRFGMLPRFPVAVIDPTLKSVILPFNERTASVAAVTVPRGSSLPIPRQKLVRLFLHWCQPRGTENETDLDLSVAFYDRSWNCRGVCSYYELKMLGPRGNEIAKSAGDLRDAPWPDGATEFVDLDRDAALETGIRYAVMVVNAYSGLPFGLLERAFAGMMLRDDPMGANFDPRTVELRFNLAGENGVYLPLVLDLGRSLIHWLDVHRQGQFEMNNVETSKKAITTICPQLIGYFESGVRASIYQIGLMHAASRCDQVFLRGNQATRFVRQVGETREAFHRRLVEGQADELCAGLPSSQGEPWLALLHRGDLELPEGSQVYALFRDRLSPTIAASDLLSG